MAHRLLLVLRRQPVAFLALFIALSGSSYAAVSAGKAGQGDVIVGCVAKDGKLRVVTGASRCTSKETAISFNREGKHGLRTTDFNSTFDTRLGTLFGGGNQTQAAGASAGAVDCWMGDLSLTARDYPSPGMMFAAGQIFTYSTLYSLLGTTYGGNGTSYFQLPDLRKQSPGQSTYEICTQGMFPSRP